MEDPTPLDQAVIVALSEVRGVCRPSELAQVVEELGPAPSMILDGQVPDDGAESEVLAELVAKLDRSRVAHWVTEIARLAAEDVHLTTVCDPRYPVNLRLIFNRPAFLFQLGEVLDRDQHAVAVVGTRKPSQEGIRIATEVAEGLAKSGVTVVSGLALGVDVAAHAAALNSKGRTIAVLGSGIERVSPVSHKAVAQRIHRAGLGAVVSQFAPAQPPQRWTFPMRNVVTSGLSNATVVVEAGPTSGARLQANNCLDHGKKLLLVDKLVTREAWAQEMVNLPGVAVVSTVAEIIDLALAETLVPAEIM